MILWALSCYVTRAWFEYNRKVVFWVLPCHWDLFTTPIEDEPLLLPGVDVPGLLDEIRAAGSEPILLPLRGSWRCG